jgi:uncharacterized protein (UPF0276 family)
MPLPATTGLGFKPQHFQDIRATRPDLGFFEVHAENYLGAGGAPHAMLTALRQDYAISIHGVGLSIGGPQLDLAHLSRIKALCDRYDPDSFSEHLAWSSHGTEYLNDLLPLPYTPETLDRVCDHVDRVQEVLGRRLLLENPSTYVIFAQSEIPETDFLAQIARRTGCGLLLDVNNVFVSCVNHRSDPLAWLDAFPLDLVSEIHLGGHDQEVLPSGPLLIDAHGAEVAEPVWALYAEVLDRAGALPTLVEWDNDVPEWHVLLAEAQRAATLLADRRQHAAAQ